MPWYDTYGDEKVYYEEGKEPWARLLELRKEMDDVDEWAVIVWQCSHGHRYRLAGWLCLQWNRVRLACWA